MGITQTGPVRAGVGRALAGAPPMLARRPTLPLGWLFQKYFSFGKPPLSGTWRVVMQYPHGISSSRCEYPHRTEAQVGASSAGSIRASSHPYTAPSFVLGMTGCVFLPRILFGLVPAREPPRGRNPPTTPSPNPTPSPPPPLFATRIPRRDTSRVESPALADGDVVHQTGMHVQHESSSRHFQLHGRPSQHCRSGCSRLCFRKLEKCFIFSTSKRHFYIP